MVYAIRRKARFFILLLAGVLPLVSFSQHKIDSLQGALAVCKTDTGKVAILTAMARAYNDVDSLNKGLSYSRQALQAAIASKYEKKEAEAMYIMGSLYFSSGENDSAIYWIKKAIVVYEKEPLSKMRVKIYKGLGDVYRNVTKYPAAIEMYGKALNAGQSLADTGDLISIYYNWGLLYDANDQFDLARDECNKSAELALAGKKYRSAIAAYNVVGSEYARQGLSGEAAKAYYGALEVNIKYLHDTDASAITNVNLGNVYDEMKDTANAFKCYRQALDDFEKRKNKLGEAELLGNIGNTYMNVGDYKHAEVYELKSLEEMQQLNDKHFSALCYSNVAEFYRKTKNYDKAKDYYTKALQMQFDAGDKEGIVYSMSGLALLYKEQGNIPKAIDYELQAFNAAEEIHLLGQVRDQAKEISDLYESQHQADRAFYYYKLYIEARDTLENKEESKKLISAELSHEYEQKQEAEKIEDAKKQAIEDEKQAHERVIRNISLGASLVFLLLAGLLLRNLTRIRKSKQIIEEQKHEVEKQKAIVDEKNKDITDSIHYASRIQKALLTTDEYIGKHVKEYFILFKPRDIVSGDFYWAIEGGAAGTFLICAGDCTGHGVPGAFMSLLNISMLNETVIERKISNPAQVLNELRNGIIRALNPEGKDDGSKDGMDCSLCAIDFKNKSMQLACANNGVWIIPEGSKTVVEIEPDKMPVGIQHGEQKPFTLHTVNLNKGDNIYLFTDGYADQFGGPKGKKFKYKQLQELIVANANKPMSEQKAILERTFKEWTGGLEQVDDVLVIGLKV